MVGEMEGRGRGGVVPADVCLEGAPKVSSGP